MAASVKDDIRRFQLEINTSNKNGETLAQLTKLEKETALLRNENAELQKTMAYLAATGRKNTEEYKRMEAQLKLNRKAVAQNGNEMKGLQKTMDLNYMSMGQLKKRAQELRSTLNATSKAANPAEYARLEKELKATGDQMDKLKGKTNATKGVFANLKQAAGGLLPILGIGAIVGGLKSLITGAFNVRAEFEKMEAVLTNTLGSKSAAADALRDLQKFAAQTPFQLKDLTASYIKLVNQGFKPTMDEMTKLGDLSSSTGKDFDQLAEAIIDAQVGEFERLKEFGVRAQKNGDKVKFTFKGVTTEIDNSSDAIRNYVTGLGEVEGVTGSMAAISQTLSGKMSNLKDSWDSFLNILGSKSSGVFHWVITQMGTFLNLLGIGIQTVAEMRKQAQSDVLKQAIKGDIAEIDALAEKYKNMGLDNANDRAKNALLSQYDSLLKSISQKLETTTDENQKTALKKQQEQLTLQISGIEAYYDEQKMLELKAEASAEKAQLAKLEKEKEIAEKASAAAKSFFDYRKNLGLTTMEEEMVEELRLFTENEQAKKLTAEEYAKATATIRAKYEEVPEKLALKGAVGGKTPSLKAGKSDLKTDGLKEKQAQTLKEIEDFEKLKAAALEKYQKLSLEELKNEELAQLEATKELGIEDLINRKDLEQEITDRYRLIEEEKDAATREKKIEGLKDYLSKIEYSSQAASSIISNIQAIEFEDLEMRRDKGLVDEQQYEKESLKIKKKYADAQFVAALAGILSNSALGIAATFPIWPLNPVWAGIVTGLITTSAVTQTALANKQRQRVKQLDVGGYTGAGGKYQEANLVQLHKNEYVIPSEAVNNPNIKPFINLMEQQRVAGTIGSMNFPQVTAAAAGGFQTNQGTQQNTAVNTAPNNEMAAIVQQNNALIQQLLSGGIKSVAFFNEAATRDITDQQKLDESLLKKTSWK